MSNSEYLQQGIAIYKQFQKTPHRNTIQGINMGIIPRISTTTQKNIKQRIQKQSNSLKQLYKIYFIGELADKLNIDESQIRKWSECKGEYKKRGGKKIISEQHDEELYIFDNHILIIKIIFPQQVYQYIVEQRNVFKKISSRRAMVFARKLVTQHKIKLQCSLGWFQKFCKRKKICIRKITSKGSQTLQKDDQDKIKYEFIQKFQEYLDNPQNNISTDHVYNSGLEDFKKIRNDYNFDFFKISRNDFLKQSIIKFDYQSNNQQIQCIIYKIKDKFIKNLLYILIYLITNDYNLEITVDLPFFHLTISEDLNRFIQVSKIISQQEHLQFKLRDSVMQFTKLEDSQSYFLTTNSKDYL
ncbi:hypothetical protein ABPG72_008346 [Tetrahymena utriculariae]